MTKLKNNPINIILIIFSISCSGTRSVGNVSSTPSRTNPSSVSDDIPNPPTTPYTYDDIIKVGGLSALAPKIKSSIKKHLNTLITYLKIEEPGNQFSLKYVSDQLSKDEKGNTITNEGKLKKRFKNLNKILKDNIKIEKKEDFDNLLNNSHNIKKILGKSTGNTKQNLTKKLLKKNDSAIAEIKTFIGTNNNNFIKLFETSHHILDDTNIKKIDKDIIDDEKTVDMLKTIYDTYEKKDRFFKQFGTSNKLNKSKVEQIKTISNGNEDMQNILIEAQQFLPSLKNIYASSPKNTLSQIKNILIRHKKNNFNSKFLLESINKFHNNTNQSHFEKLINSLDTTYKSPQNFEDISRFILTNSDKRETKTFIDICELVKGDSKGNTDFIKTIGFGPNHNLLTKQNYKILKEFQNFSKNICKKFKTNKAFPKISVYDLLVNIDKTSYDKKLIRSLPKINSFIKKFETTIKTGALSNDLEKIEEKVLSSIFKALKTTSGSEKIKKNYKKLSFNVEKNVTSYIKLFNLNFYFKVPKKNKNKKYALNHTNSTRNLDALIKKQLLS